MFLFQTWAGHDMNDNGEYIILDLIPSDFFSVWVDMQSKENVK